MWIRFKSLQVSLWLCLAFLQQKHFSLLSQKLWRVYQRDGPVTSSCWGEQNRIIFPNNSSLTWSQKLKGCSKNLCIGRTSALYYRDEKKRITPGMERIDSDDSSDDKSNSVVSLSCRPAVPMPETKSFSFFLRCKKENIRSLSSTWEVMDTTNHRHLSKQRRKLTGDRGSSSGVKTSSCPWRERGVTNITL